MIKSGNLYDLLQPKLEELKLKIYDDLVEAFEIVNCDIIDCPDFTKKPFFLSGKGICGNPIIIDVGSVSNLVPTPNLKAKFDLIDIVLGVKIPNAYICGAGAGPFDKVGVNCEIVVDARFENSKTRDNKSLLAKIDGDKNITFPATSTEFAILGQFLCCEAKAGKVLKITVERRKQDGSIMSIVQKSLAKHYGSEKMPVGLGGVFLLESGTAKIHAMPGFSDCPLDSPLKVTEWLKYFHIPAPFIAVGELVSHDPLNLDLRMEHFHGFSADRKQAGHFYFDTTPETVKCTAYFVIGEKLFRYCQPDKA